MPKRWLFSSISHKKIVPSFREAMNGNSGSVPKTATAARRSFMMNLALPNTKPLRALYTLKTYRAQHSEGVYGIPLARLQSLSGGFINLFYEGYFIHKDEE